jgi:hypothetical protein
MICGPRIGGKPGLACLPVKGTVNKLVVSAETKASPDHNIQEKSAATVAPIFQHVLTTAPLHRQKRTNSSKPGESLVEANQ